MKQKTTKLILIAFALAIMPITIYAQLDNFKLKNYKLPDLKRQGVDINFGLAGRYKDERFIKMAGDNKETSFNSNFSGLYFSYRNSRRYQGSFSTYLSGNYNDIKHKYENLNKDDAKDLYSSFNINTNNKFYFHKQYFFGVNAYAGLNYNQGKSSEKFLIMNNFLIDLNIKVKIQVTMLGYLFL
ncbi:MAG: hypothetical protein HC831_27580 [Chloroflexia bacterium]|nr:hypothetical protein [Chloroflexia bacterium]